jgi:polysaccharide deacetylase
VSASAAKGPSFPLLSGSQVCELADVGMGIASYSMTHVRLAGLPASQLQAEVSESRASLSELMGASVRGFAYAYG